MSGKLTMHARIHTKEKSYSCKYCGQKFEQINLKKDHEKIVHKNRNYENESVESNQDNFKENIEKTRTVKKLYSCKYCGQKFKQINLKKDHEKIVHVNRNYEKEPLESKQINFKNNVEKIHNPKKDGEKLVYKNRHCDTKPLETNRDNFKKNVEKIHNPKKHQEKMVYKNRNCDAKPLESNQDDFKENIETDKKKVPGRNLKKFKEAQKTDLKQSGDTVPFDNMSILYHDLSDESLSVLSDENDDENLNVENSIIKEKSSQNYLSDESLSELSEEDLNSDNLSKKGKKIINDKYLSEKNLTDGNKYK